MSKKAMKEYRRRIVAAERKAQTDNREQLCHLRLGAVKATESGRRGHTLLSLRER